MICVLYYFRSAAPNAPDELQGETSDPETKDVNHYSQVPLVQFSSSNIQSRSQLCSERLDLLKLEAVCSQGIEVSDFEDILLNTPELQEINADNAKVKIFLNRHKPGTAILECDRCSEKTPLTEMETLKSKFEKGSILIQETYHTERETFLGKGKTKNYSDLEDKLDVEDDEQLYIYTNEYKKDMKLVMTEVVLKHCYQMKAQQARTTILEQFT